MIKVSTFLLAKYPQVSRLYLFCRLRDVNGSGWLNLSISDFITSLRISERTLIRWCRHAKDLGVLTSYNFNLNHLRLNYSNQPKFLKKYLVDNSLVQSRFDVNLSKIGFDAKQAYYHAEKIYQWYRGVIALSPEDILPMLVSSTHTRSIGVKAHTEYYTLKKEHALADSKPAEEQIDRSQLKDMNAVSNFCHDKPHGIIFKSSGKASIGITIKTSVPNISHGKMAFRLGLSASCVKKHLNGMDRYQVHKHFTLVETETSSPRAHIKAELKYREITKQFREAEFSLGGEYIPKIWKARNSSFIFERVACIYADAWYQDRVCRNREREKARHI